MLQRILLCGLCLTSTLLTSPQAFSQAPVTITPDVVYGHKDGMALTFDVFKPKEKAMESDCCSWSVAVGFRSGSSRPNCNQ